MLKLAVRFEYVYVSTCFQCPINRQISSFQSQSCGIITEAWLTLLPVFLSLSVFLSHRSSTRQRRGRCSKCLRRLTKSCTRGEAAGEGYSRGCRMNVSSGSHDSHIFGIVFFRSLLSTFWHYPSELNRAAVVSKTAADCWDKPEKNKTVEFFLENIIIFLFFVTVCLCPSGFRGLR